MSSTNKTDNIDLNQFLDSDKFEMVDYNADMNLIDAAIKTNQDNINLVAPVGSVLIWTSNAPPPKYLICAGALISRTTYAALFAVIGTAFGVGDGSTTFAVPDLKGRIPVGRDGTQSEFDSFAEVGGAKTHVLTTTPGYLGTTGTAANIVTGGGGANNNLQPYLVMNYIIRVLP